MDAQSILANFTSLIKSQSDLRSILNEIPKDSRPVSKEPIIVTELIGNLDFVLAAPKGLTKNTGSMKLVFKNSFSLDIPKQKSLKFDRVITFSLQGLKLVNIKGVNVDLPGPLDPAISEVELIDDGIVITVLGTKTIVRF